MVQTKTTKVTVSNKDVPDAVHKLAEEQYLSRVALVDKAKATSYTLGEPFKIYKFNKESDLIIIIQCSIKRRCRLCSNNFS